MAAALELHLSGGANNTDPDASLGGARSTVVGGVVPAEATLNSLFDDVSGAEEQAGDVEYRGVYLYNAGDADAENVTLWLTDTVAAGTTIAIALADEGLDQVMETIANEDTAPSGPSFSTPTTEGGGLSVGTIGPGEMYGVWLRRTVTADAGASFDEFTLHASFDTGPGGSGSGA